MDKQQYQNWVSQSIADMAARRSGSPTFTTFADVEIWAAANGGELGVRVALAEGLFSAPGRPPQLVEKWIAIEERKRSDAHAAASLQADQSAAQAAMRSARYAMWSAAISAAAGLVSAASYWLSRMQT
jgi:hypothetical protein